MLKSAEKIQDQRLDQKFATSECKQQENRQIVQIFRDNFFGWEKKQQAVKSAVIDATDSEPHIMWNYKNCSVPIETQSKEALKMQFVISSRSCIHATRIGEWFPRTIQCESCWNVV